MTPGPSWPGVPLAPLPAGPLHGARSPTLGFSAPAWSSAPRDAPAPSPQCPPIFGVSIQCHRRRVSPHRVCTSPGQLQSAVLSCSRGVGGSLAARRASPRQAARLSVRSSPRSEAPSPKDWSVGFWDGPLKRPVVSSLQWRPRPLAGSSRPAAESRRSAWGRAWRQGHAGCGHCTARVLLPGSLTGRDRLAGEAGRSSSDLRAENLRFLQSEVQGATHGRKPLSAAVTAKPPPTSSSGGLRSGLPSTRSELRRGGVRDGGLRLSHRPGGAGGPGRRAHGAALLQHTKARPPAAPLARRQATVWSFCPRERLPEKAVKTQLPPGLGRPPWPRACCRVPR